MTRKLSFLLTLLLCLPFVSVAQNQDINLLRIINTHRDRSLDPLFIFITNWNSVVDYGVPVCLLLYSLIKRDHVHRWNALFLFISVLIADGLSLFLKNVINRPRPFATYNFLEKMATVTSSSFPSGHTIVAFALAAALSLAFKRWFVVLPAFFWASLIGYSRMDLGVHYPSDVGASVLLGCLVSYLVYRVQKKLAESRNASIAASKKEQGLSLSENTKPPAKPKPL